MAMTAGVVSDVRTFLQPGFVGIDGVWTLSDAQLGEYVGQFISSRLRPLELHPDAGSPIVVADPAATFDRLWAVAGDRYTYRELDDYTDPSHARAHAAHLARSIARVAERAGDLE